MDRGVLRNWQKYMYRNNNITLDKLMESVKEILTL